MGTKRVLRLHLKRKWWCQIKDGIKTAEYRISSEYWRLRLTGKEFDEIHLLLGYPKAGDNSKLIVRRWNGVREEVISHEEFGVNPVQVFSIDVSKRIDEPEQMEIFSERSSETVLKRV